MNLKCLVIALFLSSLSLAAGCSSTGGTGDLLPRAATSSFKVESEPTGAEVYVMGEQIGVTPIIVNHKDVFPNTYPREKESVYGWLTLKKAGCSDFTRSVSAEISKNGLRAQLDCGDRLPASHGTTRDAPRSSETAEQRLGRIKDLLNKGLISEDEARKARERILNDL